MNARTWAEVRWSSEIVGTSLQPSSWHANSRPCPAVTLSLASTRSGTLIETFGCDPRQRDR